MKIKFCRNCKNTKFFNLLSLGKMSFTGKFSKNFAHNIPRANLNLLMCKACTLVQLDRNYNKNYTMIKKAIKKNNKQKVYS